mmetsp:Transcript_12640/g.36300  ORF Transcript_12640/g.36300 Transcript_12640/m.36300 type:complete len:1014 (-) Transcript_12640:87-3128(-)
MAAAATAHHVLWGADGRQSNVNDASTGSWVSGPSSDSAAPLAARAASGRAPDDGSKPANFHVLHTSGNRSNNGAGFNACLRAAMVGATVVVDTSSGSGLRGLPSGGAETSASASFEHMSGEGPSPPTRARLGEAEPPQQQQQQQPPQLPPAPPAAYPRGQPSHPPALGCRTWPRVATMVLEVDLHSQAAAGPCDVTTPQTRGVSAPARYGSPADPSPLSSVPRVPSEAASPGMSGLELPAGAVGANTGSLRALSGAPQLPWAPREGTLPLGERDMNSPNRRLLGNTTNAAGPIAAPEKGKSPGRAAGRENAGAPLNFAMGSEAALPLRSAQGPQANEPTVQLQLQGASPISSSSPRTSSNFSPRAKGACGSTYLQGSLSPNTASTSMAFSTTGDVNLGASLTSAEGKENCGATVSKVAQMAALWERRLSGAGASDHLAAASLQRRPRSRSQVSASAVSVDLSNSSGSVMGRGGGSRTPRSHSCLCSRFFRDGQRATKIHERTCRMTDELLSVLREASLVASPGSASSQSSESPLRNYEEEENFMERQVHELHRNYRYMARNVRKLNTAIKSIISFQGLDGAREPAAHGACSKAIGEARVCDASDVIDGVPVEDLDAGVAGSVLISPKGRASPQVRMSSSARSSMQQQPEEEADSSALAVDVEIPTKLVYEKGVDESRTDLRYSMSSSLPDDPEREPQPKESPRDSAWTASSRTKVGEPDGEPTQAPPQARPEPWTDSDAATRDPPQEPLEVHPEGLEENLADEGSEVISPVHAESSVGGMDDSALDDAAATAVAAEAAEEAAAAAEAAMEGEEEAAETAGSEEERDECEGEDDDATMVSSPSSSSAACSGLGELSFDVAAHPRAGEEGMPRQETLLFMLEQNEMHRQVLVRVPEGMMENRLVSFIYEGKKHDVVIPQGYTVGQEVPILVPRRPPLERSQAQAMCRGHSNFADRNSILEPLRHSSRAERTCRLDDPEFRHRYDLYSMLRGTNMHPLLPQMPEEEERSRSPNSTP